MWKKFDDSRKSEIEVTLYAFDLRESANSHQY